MYYQLNVLWLSKYCCIMCHFKYITRSVHNPYDRYTWYHILYKWSIKSTSNGVVRGNSMQCIHATNGIEGRRFPRIPYAATTDQHPCLLASCHIVSFYPLLFKHFLYVGNLLPRLLNNRLILSLGGVGITEHNVVFLCRRTISISPYCRHKVMK